VSLLERIASIGKAIFTATDELSRQRALLSEIKTEVRALDDSLRDLRERVVRLEAFQDATKAELAAEVSRFKAEVERAELRATRLGPEDEPKRKTPKR
jgi:predicted  nucleic acid-binding Zn-ribbon protein